MALSISQMYEHTLTALKGWPSSAALDKTAVFDTESDPNAGTAYEGVTAGMCLSFNSSGKLIKGINNGAMPMFAMNNSIDYDAVSDTGGTAGRSYGSNGPNIGCLVATGSYELQSTEFLSSDTFNYNDPLTSSVANTGSVKAGWLKKGNFYDQDTCGVVSKAGPFKNESGVNVIQFWTYFLPSTSY